MPRVSRPILARCGGRGFWRVAEHAQEQKGASDGGDPAVLRVAQQAPLQAVGEDRRDRRDDASVKCLLQRSTRPWVHLVVDIMKYLAHILVRNGQVAHDLRQPLVHTAAAPGDALQARVERG